MELDDNPVDFKKAFYSAQNVKTAHAAEIAMSAESIEKFVADAVMAPDFANACA